MIRAFVAIPLPEETQARLELLQHMLPLPRRVPPENMHVTLAFLGAQPKDRLEEMHHACRAIRAEPLALTLQGVGIFGGRKPRNVWAGVAPSPALDHLQRKVASAARGVGIALESRRFTPHVTLARMRPHEVDLVRLEHALVACADFRADPFTVSYFALMRSHLTSNGAAYETLERYEFGSPATARPGAVRDP